MPRVAELFEARRPKDPAVVSEIDGTVQFGSVRRGVRKIIVTSKDNRDKRVYLIPYGKHLLVHEGDTVRAGEKLSEGSVVPHDILAILGANRVQEYLVNEIQEVYRLQGVRINDKHIEVIVRQMLRKVRVEDAGDTEFLEDEQVPHVVKSLETDAEAQWLAKELNIFSSPGIIVNGQAINPYQLIENCQIKDREKAKRLLDDLLNEDKK